MSLVSNINRRGTFALGTGALASMFLRRAEAAPVNTVVVELFTSQGCSSCPPADKFLGELKKMPGVIAVTINVDYWDYLGWRDTLADKAHSQRQYDYARSRGDMNVYTPQMIINGGSHYVGSNRSVVEAAIRDAQAQVQARPVSMSLFDQGEEMVVEIGMMEAEQEHTIWVMPVTSAVAVKIGRGENTGMDIVYHNVARKIVPAGMWKGAAKSLRLPKKSMLAPDCKACVALLQVGSVGPVRAAAPWGDFSA